jgi:glycosyltransferase involved in cell wall biosynthesis
MRMLHHEHEIHLFSLTEAEPSDASLEAISQVTKSFRWYKMNPVKRALRLILAAFSTRPFQSHWFYQRKADRQLHEWMKELKADVIYCQLIRMAEYVRNDHHTPRVLDYMDALSAGMKRRSNLCPFWYRWIYRLEAQRLAHYESVIFDYFDGQTIISAADRKLIAHPGRKSIAVIPNGVDSAFFKSNELVMQTKPYNSPEENIQNHFVILFTGNMSYPPNVDAAKRIVNEILPRIEMPGVRVLIAGTKPTAEVLKLANKTVTVTGWIPDLREAYEQADVFVAPLRIGTGQQNKILEAMSMSLPCITSTHVMNGLPKIGNIAPPLLLADDVVATAKAIDTLLKKEEIRLKLGRESRSWIEINCSWEVQSGALEMSFVNSTIYKPEEATWKIKR